MPRISLAFFTVGALCGLIGMAWGSYMGASANHTMLPAHAHLNLLGFVTLSLMGSFYAFAGERRNKLLARVNFVISTLGVALLIPMLAYLLAGHEKQIGPLMPIGDLTVIAGMLTFIASIIVVWRKTPAA